jgi:Tfp pilus assembly PilM family ATPase
LNSQERERKTSTEYGLIGSRLGWIGVDVGTHAVKLAQVVRDGVDVRLHRVAIIQRPTSWPATDSLALDQPVSSMMEIRAGRQFGRFKGRNAICALPMSICHLRGLAVPPGENHERRAIIEDELSAEWEEKQVEMEFDFWELESGQPEKGSDSFNVNVLSVARPWVSQVARDCRQAGLDCWAIDGAPLAMARAVSLVGNLPSGRRALAIDWGYSNTTFCVVGDGRAWYTRRATECAFGQALAAIAASLDVSLDEAQHLADTQGLGMPAENIDAADATVQEAIGEAVESTLAGLRDQARRTIQFLETQRRHLHPVAVWLLGGGGSMRNIGPWLSRELQLPVHSWAIPFEEQTPLCAESGRSALFAGAAALSALAWRAA